MHIAIEGLDGVGKTTTAKALAKEIGAEYFSKAFHEMKDNSGKYENFTTLKELSSDYIKNSNMGMRGAFLYAKYNKIDCVTERYFTTNYWSNNRLNKYEEISNAIYWLGKPELTIILYSEYKENYNRMYNRNPNDKDFPKLEKHYEAYSKMIEFVKKTKLKNILIDTTNINLVEVVDIIKKYLQGEILNGNYEKFSIKTIPFLDEKPEIFKYNKYENILYIEGNEEFLTKINLDRFSSCKKIIISEKVTKIVPELFDNFKKLQSIEVNENNKYFKSIDGVLYNNDCSQIIRYPINHLNKKYKFLESILKVHSNAFYLSHIEEVIINERCETIGYMSFFNCKNLHYVYFGKNIKKIGRNAFTGCENIIKIEGNDIFPVRDGMLLDNNKNILKVFNNSKENISIDNKINVFAFENNKKITNLLINSKVKKIEAYAFVNSKIEVICFEDFCILGDMIFWNCNNLKKVIFKSEKPPKVGKDIFRGIKNTIEIIVPIYAINEYKNVFEKFLNKITFRGG